MKIIPFDEYEWNDDNNPMLNEGCEQGPEFDSRLSSVKSKHKYSAEISKAKKNAKDSGACKLKGSTAQNNWAVQIRQNAVRILSDEMRNFALSQFLEKSKFWIENRNSIQLAIESAYKLSQEFQDLSDGMSIFPDVKNFEINEEMKIWFEKRDSLYERQADLSLC